MIDYKKKYQKSQKRYLKYMIESFEQKVQWAKSSLDKNQLLVEKYKEQLKKLKSNSP